jgi:hypothetical protein
MIALRRSSIPYLVLAAAVVAAFGASLSASFHFDDYALFGDPHVTSPSGWHEVWRPEQTRPLTYFTFWLNFQLGGREPAGYHLLSLLVHLASTLLLYGVLRKLTPGAAAFAGAALFAIHPIQTEPVVYIYARATLSMTLFCLLALREWLKGRHWIAVGWFAAAMLAKEECAAFPLFLLLLHFSISRNTREFRPIAAMVAIALAVGGRVIWVLAQDPESGAGTGSAIGLLEYLSTQGTVILRYFRLTLVPYGFTVDPEIPIASPATAVVTWLVLLGLAALATRRFSSAGAGFWFLGGLLFLLPSSSIFPADDLAADRRMYLPLIAFGPAVGLLLRRINPRALAVAGVVLAVVAALRVQVWQTETALWTEAVERSPGKLRPRLQLARASDPDRAIEILKEAETVAPDDARVPSQLGRRYLETGRPAEALAQFGRALALDPGNPRAYNNRGVVLLQLGQTAPARADFERALSLAPCLFDARLNLLRIGVLSETPAHCRYTPEQSAALSQAHRSGRR